MKTVNKGANWTDIKKNRIYMAACEYMAKTEMFNRTITDLRSQYDPTEAFVLRGDRLISNANAIRARNDVIRKYGIENKDLMKEIHDHQWYSAQKWINEYARLLKVEIMIEELKAGQTMEKCEYCVYYHKENNTCQSKKCSTAHEGYVSFIDRLLCEPYKNN